MYLYVYSYKLLHAKKTINKMKSDLPGSLYLQLTIHRNKLLQTEKEKIDNRDF